ncbi:MAG: tyrosine-type recombinase/integrase [Akkermansia sp.]|nr:tyrosine-type recombinase/integrase [Akkermansia sp.]MBQ4635419.1 tyrosine-type recombinase/integrase [Akkermansia sp.]
MNTQTPQLTVDEADIFRLFIEFTETTRATEHDKQTVMTLFRKLMQAGLHSIQPNSKALSFREVAERSLEARAHRRPSTRSDLRSYIRRFIEYAEWVDNDIRSITQNDCQQLLETHFSKSGHVFYKARTILHSIFTYAGKKGMVEKNPVYGIDPMIITEEKIEILKLSQITAFMKALRAKDLQCMQAAVRLMLWCGIRPGEVQRLKWKDVDFRENVVYIDGLTSKTGGARAVPLRGAAKELKYFQRKPDDKIAPRNWVRLWVKLRRRAGIRRWQKDVMRHTFASMHLKYFHNIHLLQEEMGHRDSDLLRTRYLNLRNLTTQAASRFFKWETNARDYAAKQD